MGAPTFSEEIFAVDDLAATHELLKKVGAKDLGEHVSRHYYAKGAHSGTLKVVERESGYELTKMNDRDGRFSVDEKTLIDSKEAGFTLLRAKGFTEVEYVEMKYHDFAYKGGIVGLYVINDVLRAVVTDYPTESLQNEVQHELLLDSKERITRAFNVVLRDTNGQKIIQL